MARNRPSQMLLASAAVNSHCLKLPAPTAAAWHKERRRQMLEKYGDQIAPLERVHSSQNLGGPLLAVANLSLFGLAIACGSLPLLTVVALSVFPGSMLSLWQLQILHDVLHGAFFPKQSTSAFGIPKKRAQDLLLFWGSLPSIYGYYLYLKYGHLTHHQNLGESNLAQLFNSSQVDFEDGDMLFTVHRMNLKGDYGPQLSIGDDKIIRLSVGKAGFAQWRPRNSVWNAAVFAASFLSERFMLAFNDVWVSLLGRNIFFPNKPQEFHQDCAANARAQTLLRLALWYFCGPKSLLFLFLSETLWSIPPHPSCAMFVTNHGSQPGDDNECVPSSSTYAGRWYSIFTLGTNYHVEHHDFPTIPFQDLHKLRQIAPEYYRSGPRDNLLTVMDKAFRQPDFYACMDATRLES